MSNPILSIIIAVYNSKEVLKKTIKSIISQGIENYEIILINDGSTNQDSLNLFKVICNDNPKIKLYTFKNQGIVRSRIEGIKKANGKYILFSDHDDYYLKGSIPKMLNEIESEGSDIIVGNSEKQILSKIPYRKAILEIKQNETILRESFLKEKYLNFFGYNQFPVATWGEIYKSSLLKNIDFEIYDYSFMDDIILNLQIFYKANKISFIKDIVYRHVGGGLTSNINLEVVTKAYIDVYNLKYKHLINDNKDGMKFVYYELKNILIHIVDKFFESGKTKREELALYLNLFKNSKAFNDLVIFYKNENEIINALENNDMVFIYDWGKERFKKQKLKIIFKKLLR